MKHFKAYTLPFSDPDMIDECEEVYMDGWPDIEDPCDDSPNGLDNCAALSKTCWKLKTAGYDRPKIDKSKRQHDRARGIRSSQFRPLPGTKASGIKKPMQPFSVPIYRDSGRPVFERGKR